MLLQHLHQGSRMKKLGNRSIWTFDLSLYSYGLSCPGASRNEHFICLIVSKRYPRGSGITAELESQPAGEICGGGSRSDASMALERFFSRMGGIRRNGCIGGAGSHIDEGPAA